jgi:hypothetical protein
MSNTVIVSRFVNIFRIKVGDDVKLKEGSSYHPGHILIADKPEKNLKTLATGLGH